MRVVKNLLVFLFLILIEPVTSQEKYSSLNEIVTDSGRIFTGNQLKGLKDKLTNFENQTTNQLVVLTIGDLGAETIETYANTVFSQNGIGQKGKDNGILILFSLNDREVRIEVGYGLEPYITDAIASRIIRNTMIPNFKEERYFQGIDEAVDELILYLKNPEVLEELKKELVANERKNKRIGSIFLIGFLSIFVGVACFLFYKSYQNLIEIFQGTFSGKLSLFYGVFMAVLSLIPFLFSLIFFAVPLVIGFLVYELDYHAYSHLWENPKNLVWILVPILGIAMVIAVIRIRLFGKDDLKISWLKNDKNYIRKTFSSSGSHALGASFSGSSSSGGFSGGGGSSGGGGASGSW